MFAVVELNCGGAEVLRRLSVADDDCFLGSDEAGLEGSSDCGEDVVPCYHFYVELGLFPQSLD
jgi:hypothetical protein